MLHFIEVSAYTNYLQFFSIGFIILDQMTALTLEHNL